MWPAEWIVDVDDKVTAAPATTKLANYGDDECSGCLPGWPKRRTPSAGHQSNAFRETTGTLMGSDFGNSGNGCEGTLSVF